MIQQLETEGLTVLHHARTGRHDRGAVVGAAAADRGGDELGRGIGRLGQRCQQCAIWPLSSVPCTPSVVSAITSPPSRPPRQCESRLRWSVLSTLVSAWRSGWRCSAARSASGFRRGPLRSTNRPASPGERPAVEQVQPAVSDRRHRQPALERPARRRSWCPCRQRGTSTRPASINFKCAA